MTHYKADRTGQTRVKPASVEPIAVLSASPAAQYVYCDNHVLIALKPHGMPTQGDESQDANLLEHAKQHIKEQFNKPGKVFLGLLHRLDRPAGGLLVMARTSKAASRLSQQFRNHVPLKRYLAIVESAVATPTGVCEDYLRKDSAKRKSFVVNSKVKAAKHARLSWRRLAVENGRSLLEISLDTGRPHQIRAQLASRGMPIVGDKKYGAASIFFGGRGIALHSCLLGIRHPVGAAPLIVRHAPLHAWGSRFSDQIQQYINDVDLLKCEQLLRSTT